MCCCVYAGKKMGRGTDATSGIPQPLHRATSQLCTVMTATGDTLSVRVVWRCIPTWLETPWTFPDTGSPQTGTPHQEKRGVWAQRNNEATPKLAPTSQWVAMGCLRCYGTNQARLLWPEQLGHRKPFPALTGRGGGTIPFSQPDPHVSAIDHWNFATSTSATTHLRKCCYWLTSSWGGCHFACDWLPSGKRGRPEVL